MLVLLLFLMNLPLGHSFENTCESDSRLKSVKLLEPNDKQQYAVGAPNITIRYEFQCNRTLQRNCRHHYLMNHWGSTVIDCSRQSEKNWTTTFISSELYFIVSSYCDMFGDKDTVTLTVTNLMGLQNITDGIRFTHPNTCYKDLVNYQITHCQNMITMKLHVKSNENASFGDSGTFACINPRAKVFRSGSPAVTKTTCDATAHWEGSDQAECWYAPIVESLNVDGNTPVVTAVLLGETISFNCRVTDGFPSSISTLIIGDWSYEDFSLVVDLGFSDRYAYCKTSNAFTEYYGYQVSSNRIRIEVFAPPTNMTYEIGYCACKNTKHFPCDISFEVFFIANPAVRKDNLSAFIQGRPITGNVTKIEYEGFKHRVKIQFNEVPSSDLDYMVVESNVPILGILYKNYIQVGGAGTTCFESATTEIRNATEKPVSEFQNATIALSVILVMVISAFIITGIVVKIKYVEKTPSAQLKVSPLNSAQTIAPAKPHVDDVRSEQIELYEEPIGAGKQTFAYENIPETNPYSTVGNMMTVSK